MVRIRSMCAGVCTLSSCSAVAAWRATYAVVVEVTVVMVEVTVVMVKVAARNV
jgi:hypothetical protein